MPTAPTADAMIPALRRRGSFVSVTSAPRALTNIANPTAASSANARNQNGKTRSFQKRCSGGCCTYRTRRAEPPKLPSRISPSRLGTISDITAPINASPSTTSRYGSVEGNNISPYVSVFSHPMSLR